MSRMAGRVAVVTGAAQGMGRSHCVRLAEEGADIVAIDLTSMSDDLADTAAAVERTGRRCLTGTADIRDLDELLGVVGSGMDRFGRIDAVVANAGVYPTAAPAWELDIDTWRDVLGVNLTGAWHTVKACVPMMSPGGAVVLIGSTNAIKGAAGVAHYCAGKHGVIGLAQALANELGAQGIRVNTVNPGSVGTSMILNDRVFARLRPDLEVPSAEDAAQALASRNLLGVPWVEPVDVSNAVVFLLSDDARYITGTNVVVDAGLLAKAS